jgi:hypothetical protein
MAQTNKYANGKIYRITDISYTKCYIGSTVQRLSARLAKHRHGFKAFLEGKATKVSSYMIFQEFGLDNCKIELVEEFPCVSKEQLLKKEGEYIQLFDCVNKFVSGRTMQEYFETFKEQIQERRKAYTARNEEHIKAYKADFYERNKEEIQRKKKEYYRENKCNILAHCEEYRKQKVECPICSSVVQKGKFARHQLSMKCQRRKLPPNIDIN